jgi:outer membrane protein, heavy metal efflux system
VSGARRLLLLLAALGAGACARVPVRESFDEARALVRERTEARVEWLEVTAQPAEVEALVDGLLAGPLGAEDAVQIALLSNRRLQAAFAELGRAAAQRTQAGLPSNPVVEAVAKFHAGEVNVELSVVHHLLGLLLLPARKRLAAAEFERARLDAAAQAVDLAARTRRAFYRYQAEQQLLELDRTALAALEAAYEMALALREAGNIRQLDLLVERDFYEQMKLEAAQRESELLELRERLSSLMGLWGARTGWTAEPHLPDVPPEPLALEAIEHRAVSRSLDLGMGFLELEAAARRQGITNVASVLPGLEVGIEAEREVEIESDGHAEVTWWVGPSVGFELPLFDQGQARRVAGRMEVRRLWELYTARAIEVRSAARRVAQREAHARARAIYTREVLVPLRVAITMQSQLLYNAMDVGVFQLLEAKRREIEAGRAYVRALGDFWEARADLDQLMAGRLAEEGAGQMPAEPRRNGMTGGGRAEEGH